MSSEASAELSASAKVPEVRTRTGRLIQHTRYEPKTGRTVQFLAVEVGAVQNYHDFLAELDNEEFQANVEVANAFAEIGNVGAGISSGFENTTELKPMK